MVRAMVSRRGIVGVMVLVACGPRPPPPVSARAHVSPPAHASAPAADADAQRIDKWWHTIADGKDAETAWGFTAVVHGVGGPAERCTGEPPIGPDCLTSLLHRVAPPKSWYTSGDCPGEHSCCGTTSDIKVVVQLDDAGVKAIAFTGRKWISRHAPH
jgi:hypothetical protein